MFGIVKQLKRIADAQEAQVNQHNECLALWREVQKNSDDHLRLARSQYLLWLEDRRKPNKRHHQPYSNHSGQPEGEDNETSCI